MSFIPVKTKLDMCKILLESTMEGRLSWRLPEVDELRRNLESVNSGIYKLYTMGYVKRQRMKTAKRLRRKLRILDHETASEFETKIIFELENSWGFFTPHKYVVRVILNKDKTIVRFFRPTPSWSDFSVERITNLVSDGEVTSEEMPELSMLPFLLRDKELIKFHKESRHVQEDF